LHNAYYNGGYVYASSNPASYYQQSSGNHTWYNAPSGTAGNAITFTQAMTLNASGNLILGNGAISNPISFIRVLNINGGDAGLVFSNTNGTAKNWSMGALDNGSFSIYDGSTFRFSIGSTGAAIFSSSVSIPSASSPGQGYYYFNYLSTQANSRTWRLANDYNDYGDFQLQQSTTQTGTTFAKILGFSAAGAATFTGSVTATGFFESSDSRLKTLIQDNYQTKGIASITPKLYTKNGKVELGYYAQDFVGILDSAVSKGNDDMLSLSYREVLVAKVYALEQEIKELKAKIN
jgi:hypothetical protein